MATAAEGSALWFDRDLEARKHLWKGLQRLEPFGVNGRVAFLSYACTLAPTKLGGFDLKVTGHTGTVQEAYYDLVYASCTHGLSLSKVCAALELWLKKAG